MQSLALPLLAATVIALLLAAPTAHALRSTPATTYVTNGPVNAIAPSAKAIYIGGAFTRVGPRTGPAVGIDSASAKAAALPEVAGGTQTVAAVAPDGSGGYYIGGSFTHVGGLPLRDLAHVLSGGKVDPNFTPSPTGNAPYDAVRTLTVSGGTLYVGGYFSRIGGKPRNNIAALNRASGQATTWNPNANGTVSSLVATGQVVYAGGDFNRIGGRLREGIAGLDATAGTATGWNPNSDGFVHAMAISGSTLFVGGVFNSIGGQPRNNIAALNRATGQATTWNPNAAGFVNVLAVSGSTVYAGGDFNMIGGKARAHIAALNATTGAATGWNPSASGSTGGDASTTVPGLAVAGSTIYAGGVFDEIGGKPRDNVAALDATSGQASGLEPARERRRRRPRGLRPDRLRRRRVHLRREPRPETTWPRSTRDRAGGELGPRRGRHHQLTRRLRPDRLRRWSLRPGWVARPATASPP